MKKFLIAFCLFSAGCSVGKYDKEHIPSYVTAYEEMTGIEVDKLRLYDGNPDLIALTVTPVSGAVYYRNHPDAAISTRYEELCRKHNDTDFNRKDIFFGDWPAYMDKDFVSIEVSSDADFDDAHTAGSSLDDIVRIYSASPIKFIRSGYTDQFDWDNFLDAADFENIYNVGNDNGVYKKSYIFPTYKLLSETAPEDMILMGQGRADRYPICVLKLTTKPVQAGTHTITVTMIADDGTEFSDSLRLRFE